MKRKIVIGSIIFIISVVAIHLILGYGYIFKAISYAYLRGQKGPGINEHHLFYNYKFKTEKPVIWKNNLPDKLISDEDISFLNSTQTAAFLVIQSDEIVHESYFEEFDKNVPTNSFSAVKSMVSLCVGIAIEEGFIDSVDQKVCEFIPEFKNGELAEISIRHLLTMSSGLSWSESGKNPYSNNAEAYYGSNLRNLVTSQTPLSKPGKIFDYKSGDTQLLCYIVEESTGLSIGEFFNAKIWSKINAENNALWNLDSEGGDEKGFCCFYATARDFAKIGKLVLNNGNWDGIQIVPKKYLKSCLYPANEVTEKDGSKNNRYGWQWWYAEKDGKQIHYARGLLGQYIIIIPEDDLIIVRTGWKRKKLGKDGHPIDFWDYINITNHLIF